MNLKNYNITLFIFFIFSVSGCAQKVKISENNKPNLIFIVTDQQSFDMLGCYGNTQIITPNIDKLAENSVQFNRGISTSPHCTPFRGMLLSGLHPIHNGALNNDIRMLSSKEIGKETKYFGEVLRDGNYNLGYIGKWHLYGGDRNRPIPEGPYRYGFDDVFLSNNCTLQFGQDKAYFWDEKGEKTLYEDWEPYGQTKQALNFIDERAKKPFALFINFHPPHDWKGGNYEAPKELMSLYNQDTLKVRGNAEDTLENRIKYQGHMAMVTSIDKSIGWIMDKLKEKNITDNTIIVFTSDHGDLLMSHGWPNNKGRPENESIHVPLIISYPAKLKPRKSDLIFGTLDFMPTILTMMDLPVPTSVQGKNLLDAIIKQDDDVVKYTPIFNFNHEWKGVYTKRYTYSFSTKKGITSQILNNIRFERNCLYDREKDPLELKNLFNSPEYASVKDTLHANTLEWMKELNDIDVSYKKIAELIKVTSKDKSKKWPKDQGLIKGEPIKILKQAGY